MKVAPSTVWKILKKAGIDPATDRSSTTWADFLRSQAKALLACDFFETLTLTGTRMFVLAVIEHYSRRIRMLGATAHPCASWVTQAARNLVMDLQDAGCRARFLIRDQHHLLRTLREFEAFYNTHRPHQAIANARPLRPLPPPITDLDEIAHLDIRRHQRLSGILNEYGHVA